ncbi:BTB/POZ domain-containing protein isoform 2 [Schistosoma japonicum]|uniref:BTB/POZ domain-containing protein isoform 2 n=2 Tax=Schistosoma japonicum TaxID=6182 RepID=A0A4Z2CTY6_SCHJA|nr:BTB/POZ domain-containing protein isoform 2 [Schistosoma japonicum]TNN07718.1 BTB/POZ domain-containing protein isoform 2 [Schistosoma japonicum]
MSDELSPQQLQSQAQTEHQDQAQNSSTGREDETTQRLATPITNQEQHEAYPRERRHDRNVSFRHRRHQDLSPRFEDDRNIIYLNDLNTRHYRSQNLLSDPSAFWFQRSASARNIRLRSGVSHSHLHVDDRLTNQIRRSFHDRSNGLSQDTLVERQNVVLVPMYGLLRPRRSRNRSHRLSADLENPQRRQVELDIPGCRNLNNSLSSPMNDDVGDRPIIFTNPTNRTPLQQPLSLNTAQTLSLRSPNEGNSDCVSQIVRSQPRTNSVQTSRTTQGVQTRGLYQGQLRRHQNDTTPHRYIDGGHVGHETFVMNCASNVSRSAGIHQNESGVVIPNNNSNGNNEQTTETVDTYDSPNMSRDREIYVLRNIQSSSHPLQLSTIDNASMTTTSISDASSIEDLHVTEIIANSHNESVIHRPRLYESSNSNTEKISKRQEIKHSELRADVNDWRANLIGSRQLWRQMLITERFADVWFIVGGDDILGSNGTLSLHSNDPGAPGGPTSQINCCSNKQMLNVSTRSSNYSNNINKSRIMYNNNTNTTNNNNDNTNPATTITITTRNNNNNNNNINGNSNNNNNNANNSNPIQNGCIDVLHSRCSDSDQENTIDDATDLNSDSEQPSGHSDHSIENKSSTNVNKSHDYNSQMIQLKDDKNQFKVNSSSKTNNSNYTHQIDNCTSNHNGSYQETNDTEPLVWRFAAHRLILAAASPVFEAMFYGPMADCDNKGSENRLEYHIPDIHPKAFQIMLSYIYSDELLVENDIDLLFYVLYATKKYILPRLTQICVEYLKDLITADNVCMMLDRSIFFDEVDLTHRCWHVIDVLAPDVLASQGLLTLNANCVHDLVSRNTLNCQESEVFAAVGRWAGAECIRLGIRDVVSNRVQVAANILPLIRFPTMTLSDFAENVAYSGYLSLEMVRDLFVYITTNKLTAQNKDVRSPTRRSNSVAVKKNDNSNELTENETTLSNPSVSTSIRLPIQSSQLTPNSLPDSGPFPREPRTGPKLYRCCRFKRIRKDLLSLTASNNHRHTISFSVSESIFIAGVGIYGSTQAGDIRTVHVELKSGNGSTPLLSPANPTPGGIQLSERIHFSHASRSTSDLTNLNASTRLFNNTNNNNGRYSNVWDNTALSRLDEGDSPNIQVNSTNHSNKKRSTKCLASKQISLRSDGTNRVYDIRFECPVKLIKNRRYYLCLNTSNGDHTASMSTSSTAINSSTSYIGFYGGTEILIHCPSEETLKKRELELKINKTSINIKKKQLEINNKSTYITNYNDNSHLLGNNETVIFNFHDSWDGLENGNVDRGLIPDLLFYTCF